MSTTTAAATHKVPFGQKVAFGLGMLANQMFPAALGIFMVVLVQDLGFPGWMWGVLFFLPRVFDSVTDPIMGFISDNTRSTWGRRKQYVFIGAIIMGISFVTMWQLYREDGVTLQLHLLPVLVVRLLPGADDLQHPLRGHGLRDERRLPRAHQHHGRGAVDRPVGLGDRALVLGGDVRPELVRERRHRHPHAVDLGRRGLHAAGHGAGDLHPQPVDQGRRPPRAAEPAATSAAACSEILLGFKEAFGSVPFRKLCFATFLIFNAFNTVAAFSFFIVVYHLFSGNAAAAGIWPTLFGSIGALITTFAVIPTVAWMSRKMGKKNAFMLSQGISIIGYVLLWFLMVPGKPYMFMFALPFFSFGIGGLFTLMMSMTADVCDLDELATGKRREGIFGAIYWWMVKFGFAIAGLLSGAIMTLVGFSPSAAVQPEGAVDGLRLFYSGVPIFGTLLAMWVMRDYDLDEERATEVHAELERRKRLAAGPSSQGSGARIVAEGAGPGPVGRGRHAAWPARRRERDRGRCSPRCSRAACTACASAPTPRGRAPATCCRSRRSAAAWTSSRPTRAGSAPSPAPTATS